MNQRIAEIDMLRTIAIILMITYHAAYDLHTFAGWQFDLYGNNWQAFRILTASLFLLVSGLASNFSKRPLRRAGIILACALTISIVTYIYDPSTFIYFGILHCIGVGMLLLIPLKKLKEMNILLGFTILLFPFSSFLFPFPIRPTLDYYPLIPWFGLMLIGSGIGHYLYIRKTSFFSVGLGRRRAHTSGARLLMYILTLPGKHALLIYMIHQPILLGILYMIW